MMLAEWELIGIPVRILVSLKSLEKNSVEIFDRQTLQTKIVSLENCLGHVSSIIK